jgi:hypothetical protein
MNTEFRTGVLTIIMASIFAGILITILLSHSGVIHNG